MSYVDDSTNLIACNSVKELESYIRKFNLLLVYYYGSNRLKLNDGKTVVILMKNKFKKELSFTASNGELIWNKAQIKILGIYVNPMNHMETNITRLRSAAFGRLCQLKPILESMKTIKYRRLLISSSVNSILRYCSLLYCGQKEEIKSKFHTAIICAYRVICNNSTYLMN